MITGFTCGAWDLLHPGHVHHLMYCWERCTRLIVGLHINPQLDRKHKNKPIQTTFERYFQLSSFEKIERIVPYDTEEDLINIIHMIHIDKRFVGSDYKDVVFTGRELCKDNNIEIVYVPRNHMYSTSELRNRVKCN